jgi:hypothetical protein
LPYLDIQLVFFLKVTRQEFGRHNILVDFADKKMMLLVEMDIRVHDVAWSDVLTIKAVMPRWSG